MPLDDGADVAGSQPMLDAIARQDHVAVHFEAMYRAPDDDDGCTANSRIGDRHATSISAFLTPKRKCWSMRGPANNDPRNQPAYALAEAARYVKLPTATLRAWTIGRPYPTRSGGAHFRPLIRPATREPLSLSFWNLIEAHVLRALRTEHGVSIDAVRKALDFAERELKIERLLLRPELRSSAGKVFLDRYGKLIDLSASGQLAMRQVLEAHLARVNWDRGKFPVRLHPFLFGEVTTQEKPITIDPSIAFGRPIISDRGISTAAIVERIDAGETPADVAVDYNLTLEDIEQAVLYERAA